MKTTPSLLPADQHNKEIHENRMHWEQKPVLQKIYGAFYRRIASVVSRDVSGKTVELGSGMGNIKQHLPDCITTDLFQNPWLDRVENAYDLSFEDGTVANLIMFDVLHHLEYPGRAFAEAARVVRPGGRVIVFDHDMGLLPRWICRAFHHEPLGFRQALAWDAPPEFSVEKAPYYAGTGNAYRIFNRGECAEGWSKQWRIIRRFRLSSFAWLACGGLRGPQLFPDVALPVVNAIDRVCNVCPALFAARLLVVLERGF